MKDRAIDEFESMFRNSVVPPVIIDQVPIDDVLLVASFSSVNGHALKVAMEVARRHSAKVRIVFPLIEPHEDLVDETVQAGAELERLAGILNEAGMPHQTHIERGEPEVVLDRICKEKRPDLVIVPSPIIPHSSLKRMKVLCAATEYLLIDADVPTMLIKNDRVPAAGVFAKVLMMFNGVAKDIRGFSLVFSLVDAGGSLKVLNILDQDVFDEEHEAMSKTTEMATQQASEAIQKTRRESLEKIVKKLKEVVTDRPYDVTGEFYAADPIEKTRSMIVGDYHSLLVVRPPDGRRHALASLAFSLAHEIDEVPVLALQSKDVVDPKSS